MSVIIYWITASFIITTIGLCNNDVRGAWDKWVFSAPWWLNILPTGLVGIVF